MDRKEDISKIIDDTNEKSVDINGIIMITFSKSGNTFVDYACSRHELADAICQLSHLYDKALERDNEIN